MSTLVLNDNQQCELRIAPVDAVGNPAPIDGIPTWASADESIITVSPAANGLSATIVTTGALGGTQVSVQADADLGSGVTTLTGTLDVQVVAGQATSLNISAETPMNKP